MVVFTVMVMNKAGSLLFVQDYAEIPKVSECELTLNKSECKRESVCR